MLQLNLRFLVSATFQTALLEIAACTYTRTANLMLRALVRIARSLMPVLGVLARWLLLSLHPSSLLVKHYKIYLEGPIHCVISSVPVARPPAPIKSGASVCRFYPGCTNMNCRFFHPKVWIFIFEFICFADGLFFVNSRVALVPAAKTLGVFSLTLRSRLWLN